jgi:holo-[acyl-carrier protein] synthase
MIIEIGVDAASISEIERLMQEEGENSSFVRHTFSQRERQEAHGRLAEYYAARYAVKEAVFKAAAPVCPEKGFDFRGIESSHHEDCSPYVVENEMTRELMRRSGITRFLVSVTTEGDLAIAFVVAEGKEA